MWETAIFRLPEHDPVTTMTDDTDDGASSFGERWLDVLNDAGAFSFNVWADDPDADSIRLQDEVQFIDETVAIFGGIIEERSETIVARDEEAGQLVTFSGRQKLALLEWARVEPWLGVGRKPIETDRLFNWTSPPFDDSTWIPAGDIMSVDSARFDWPLTPVGVGFPVAQGYDPPQMIWDPGANREDAPDGECYFRAPFTAPADGKYVLFVIVDNIGEFYIDSQFVGSVKISDASGFFRATVIPIELTAGDHIFAARAENLPVQHGGLFNPGALAFAMFRADASNRPIGDPILISSNGTTLVYGYPSYPPGMTVGQAMDILLNEAQSRGLFPWLTWTFDDAVDTDGNPWPFTGDLSTKTGSDYLTTLKEWCVTYCDAKIEHGGWELRLAAKGTLGVSSGVTLSPAPVVDPDSGNLVEYEVTVQ